MNGEKKIARLIQVENKNHFHAIFSVFRIDDRSGSTAISCLIDKEHVYFLNVGDSRGIFVSTEGRVLLATKDHKPSRRFSVREIF